MWCERRLAWTVDVSHKKNRSSLTRLSNYFDIKKLEIVPK